MSRLALYTQETAPETSQARVEKVQKNMGFLPNLIGTLAGSPQALETYQTVGLINGQTSLSFAEREVVQITAARLHGCGFCVAGHTATVIKNKVLSDAQALALHEGKALDDARLQAIAEFTHAIIAYRGAVPDALLAAFLAAGYTQQQALEVVLGVSLATLCNFSNNLAQNDINPQLQAYAAGTFKASV